MSLDCELIAQNRESEAYSNYLAILFKRDEQEAEAETAALTDEQVAAIMRDPVMFAQWENGE
jgi:hypothetical protein